MTGGDSTGDPLLHAPTHFTSTPLTKKKTFGTPCNYKDFPIRFSPSCMELDDIRKGLVIFRIVIDIFVLTIMYIPI